MVIKILGTVKFGRSYLFMAVYPFRSARTSLADPFVCPQEFILLLHPFLHFLLLWSSRQTRHPTYNHFPRKISSSRFHIAGLSKSISSCLLQTGPMLHRCQIWYLNNEKGNSRLVGLKYFELLQIPNLQVFSNSGESDAQMQWVQIHQFVTDCTNFPSSSSPLVTFPWFSCALLFLWLLLFLHLSILVAVRFLRSWPAAITSTNRPISRRKQHQTTRSQYNPGSYNL